MRTLQGEVLAHAQKSPVDVTIIIGLDNAGHQLVELSETGNIGHRDGKVASKPSNLTLNTTLEVVP